MDLAADLADLGTIALAGLFGAILGAEREIAGKPAGLRTHVFVAAASALLVLLSEGSLEFFEQRNPADRVEADPVRVIQAIVVGISFLGAGTIIQRGSGVEGLTTAASILLTATIGIGVAVGRPWLAAGTTLFALFVLISARPMEKLLGRYHRPPDEESAGRAGGRAPDRSPANRGGSLPGAN